MVQKSGEKVPLRVLYLEDSRQDVEIIRELLSESGYILSMDCTEKKDDFISLLYSHSYDLILSDYTLPGIQAPEALQLCLDYCPNTPFICVSGSIGEVTAIELIRAGAVDYVLKDRLERLPIAIKRALNEVQEKKILQDLEDAQQKSEQQYRMLFDQMTSGFALLGTNPDEKNQPYNFRFLQVNPAFELLTGFDAHTLQGKQLTEILPTSGSSLINHVKEIIITGKNYPFELYVRELGRFIYFRVYCPETGKLALLFDDITERKNAEKALHSAEDKFEKAFRTTPDAMNINRMEDGLYVSVNESFIREVGYTWEELEGKTSRDINVWVDQNDRAKLLEGLKKDGTVQNLTAQFRAKNGNIVWGMMSATIIQLDGIPHILSITRNVTEHKRAEEALRETQEQFSLLFNSSLDAVLLAIPDGKILSANPAACKLFGRTEEEICFIGRGGLVDATDPRFIAAIEERTRTGRFYGEITMLRKDGTKFPAEISSSIFKDKEGRDRTSLIIRDISERNRMETVLRERDIQFRKLTSQVPGMVYQFMQKPDGSFCVPYASEGIKEIFGCSPRDVLDDFSPIAKVIYPEDLNEVVQSIKKSAENLTLWQCEYRVQIPGQPVRWMLGQSMPEKLSDGRIVWHGFNTDITERKQSEEKIAEQARLLDVALDIIIVRDMNDRLLFWNKAAEKTYGWTFEEAQKFGIHNLISVQDHSPYEMCKKEFIQKGEWEGELHQLTKDGRSLIIYSRWTMVHDRNGKPSARLIISRDVTEQRALESQLRRAQRLENLGAIAGGIAHDLNNVLAPVLMATQVLHKRAADPQIKDIAEALEKNILRGRDIVKQVLLFARGGEEGHIPQQLKYIIGEMKTIIRETFPRNISLRINVDESLSNITGDGTQLHQVLMNLCVNARDAMPQGGQLKIHAANVTINDAMTNECDGMKPGRYVLLSIADTGSGIPKDIQAKVFEPFFTTKEIGKGTGLGLSTVASIVKSHKGCINLSSEEGKGTEFRIYFPAILEKEQEAAIEMEKRIQSSHGETILLVDDEMTILQITKETLETYGYHVIMEDNGADAIARFMQAENGFIKLAIIDSNMPGMDGVATIQALRQYDPHLKIILSSGVISEASAEKAKILKVQGTLLKPYTAQTMLETVWSVLNR